jgi:hypothetical protein
MHSVERPGGYGLDLVRQAVLQSGGLGRKLGAIRVRPGL